MATAQWPTTELLLKQNSSGIVERIARPEAQF